MKSFTTASADETIAIGREIGRGLPRHACVLLTGNLGAGKTTLAKGILSGLGVATEDEVASPTFTLIHEYGEGRAYHIDLYRLETAEQVRALGIDEILDSGAVVLIEWGERFPQLWPKDRIEVRLASAGEENREIIVID